MMWNSSKKKSEVRILVEEKCNGVNVENGLQFSFLARQDGCSPYQNTQTLYDPGTVRLIKQIHTIHKINLHRCWIYVGFGSLPRNCCWLAVRETARQQMLQNITLKGDPSFWKADDQICGRVAEGTWMVTLCRVVDGNILKATLCIMRDSELLQSLFSGVTHQKVIHYVA